MENTESKNGKTKKKGSWRGALAEGLIELLVELLMMAVLFAAGCLIFLIVPRGKLTDIDSELVMLCGMLVLAVPVAIGIVIFYLIKKKRGRKMVNCVYKTLGKKYNLTTTVLTRKMHGEYTDVYILKGKSESGSFELYRDGLDLVFAPIDAKEIRLTTPEDAISEIEKFMSYKEK